MSRFIDIAGMKFGRLHVIQRAQVPATRDGFKNAMWECVCDCGNKLTAAGANLRKGTTFSCGCFHKERVSAAKTSHGRSNTPEHRVWSGMLQRCHTPSSTGYYNYGAKGIAVCERWRMGFSNFYEDMGPRPKGHSLDRIDNTQGYSPENCRWTTTREQSRNTSRTVKIAYNGNTHCLSDWALLAGVGRNVIYSLIRGGIAPSEAVAQCMEKRWKVGRPPSKVRAEAAKLGVTTNAIYRLMKKGMTVEAAVRDIQSRQDRSRELRESIGH